MKYLLSLGLLIQISGASFSQNLLGISTSRFGGTNRLYINPALAADSPSRFYLNVFTGNGHVDNNYVRYQAPFSLLRLITGNVPAQYKSADGSIRFETDYTRETLDGKPKNGTIWGEVRGPSFLMQVGERGAALAFTTRFRAIGQVIGASEGLLSAFRASLNTGGLYSIPITDNKFGASTNTYSELGVTYALPILEGDGRKILFGTTAKLLLGYHAQRLINRGMSYRIVQDPAIPNTNLLEVSKLDATLAYTTFLQNRSLTPSVLFSPSSPGRGFGLDLGFTYVDQYDADSPALQLGIALTDIGGLTYKGEEYSYTDLGSNPVRFSTKDFNNLSGTGSIVEVIQNKLTTGRAPDSNTFRVGLPTSLNLQLDYQLPSGFGLNLTYLQDVRSTSATATHQPTLIAVTPRYDSRWVSASVPIGYLNGGLTAGGSVRIGPGWLGTDNLLGLLGNSSNGIQPRGLDIYAGIAFGLGKVEEN
ncbi:MULTISPECIES: DUF5723 family protein [unclassified Spirosoma]|uniref:DUF5723 family protein n=1 Tax=unclassified Spirosoma TaxID=2621999 RepID=UPI000961CACC|nr:MULTISPECIES: DUF5723 family protein [unclassified Spirosoma]MBN8824389.1 hypothetical protein [Spirosoma sp.]OJW70147.1 MAG: hypothetical protein BGO59_26095 [Spirosoma sp. 48-14]